jgi:hypothetical protein
LLGQQFQSPHRFAPGPRGGRRLCVAEREYGFPRLDAVRLGRIDQVQAISVLDRLCAEVRPAGRWHAEGEVMQFLDRPSVVFVGA